MVRQWISKGQWQGQGGRLDSKNACETVLSHRESKKAVVGHLKKKLDE